MVNQKKQINYSGDFRKNPVYNFAFSIDDFFNPVIGEVRYNPSLNALTWFDGVNEQSHFSAKLSNFQPPDSDVFWNNFKITNVASPTQNGDVANKLYVDTSLARLRSWKELLLIPEQLSNTNKCVLQSTVFYLAGNASIGDTFIITDGITTEVFTFVLSRVNPFEVTLGIDGNASLTNLVNAINLDSVLWQSVLKTNLNSINTIDGYVSIISRKDQLNPSYNDRIFGVFADQSATKTIHFTNQVDYSSSLVIQMPSIDPNVKTFGIGRTTFDLVPNETHSVRSEDTKLYIYDSDSMLWQVIQASTYLANAPISLVSNTFFLNYLKGLTVVSGNLEVKLNANSGLTKSNGVGLDELSIVVDNSTLEILTNILQVKDLGITTNKIANNSVNENKLTVSVAGNSLTGGNGLPLNVNKTLVPYYYSFTITGDSINDTFTLIHGANTNKINVTVINESTGENEEVFWKRNNLDPNNKVDIVFNPVPVSGLIYTIIVTTFG